MNDWHDGDWMQTYTGKRFYPFSPKPEQIDIVDIAHALAHTCRFGGHSKVFYSVAQHSVLMAQHAARHQPHNALRALMHDAAEAYVGDLVRPIKKHPEMGSFGLIEDSVERTIAHKFGLPWPIMNTEIKKLDNRVLHDEREQVMTVTDDDWNIVEQEPLGVTIDPWPPAFARERFLFAFQTFTAPDWPQKDVDA